METIEEQIVKMAWVNAEEIVYFMKGTAGIPATGLSLVAMLELLRSGWTALPF